MCCEWELPTTRIAGSLERSSEEEYGIYFAGQPISGEEDEIIS